MDIILQDLDPRETYLKWFSSNTSSRPNGRKLFEIPKINFKSGIVSTAEGSVMVNYGDTIIVSTIKCEVAEPEVSYPEKGFLVANFHFAAGARNDVKPGPPSEEVQNLTEKLSKIIKSHVVDLNSLCIVPNALSRVLFLDAVCICDTGYAFEAALLASMISLKQAILHIPNLNVETGLVCIDALSEPQKINLASWPCSFSFAVLNKSIMILEPDSHEKSACGKSKFNVVVDLFSGSIIEIDKGYLPVEDEVLFKQIQPILKTSCDSIRSLLELQ